MYPNIEKLALLMLTDNQPIFTKEDAARLVEQTSETFDPQEMEVADAWLATLTEEEITDYAMGDEEDVELLQLRAPQIANEVAEELFCNIVG